MSWRSAPHAPSSLPPSRPCAPPPSSLAEHALVIDLAGGTLTIRTTDGAIIGTPRYLSDSHGVTLECDRTDPVLLRYDALGIGRMTAASFRIRRRGVTDVVTVSAYGRVKL